MSSQEKGVMIVQKILSGPHLHIKETANEHLAKGWRVATGDGMIVVSSVEYRPNERLGGERLTQFETYLTVVLEKDES